MKKVEVKIKTPDGFVIRSQADAFLYGLAQPSFSFDTESPEELLSIQEKILNNYNGFTMSRLRDKLIFKLGYGRSKNFTNSEKSFEHSKK